MNAWILVNIGCIECGVSSAIVGVFTDKERADALADELSTKYHWREMGQNNYEVFAMPTFDIVADEYQKALQEAPAP